MALEATTQAKSDNFDALSRIMRSAGDVMRPIGRFLRPWCRNMSSCYRILREPGPCVDSKHPISSYYVLFIFLQRGNGTIG